MIILQRLTPLVNHSTCIVYQTRFFSVIRELTHDPNQKAMGGTVRIIDSPYDPNYNQQVDHNR